MALELAKKSYHMQVSSVWRTFLPLQKKVFPIFEAALEVQR
jgi:hypothetical protein